MPNFVVRVDHLTEDQLSFFGWIRLDTGDEFSLYWNPRYNETQPVSNDPPRYLVVDDVNDAGQMGGGSFINGPVRPN
jgi:hypothetical protein